MRGEKEYINVDDYLPIFELLQDKVEGDVVTVNVPIFDSDDNLEFNLQMNLRLAQRDYRYKNFGNFEEVLKAVTRSVTKSE